jgi:hypothetical protein
MNHIEILASFYSGAGLRQEAAGLGIVSCALLAGGFYLWRINRSLKKDTAEELEQEHHHENLP